MRLLAKVVILGYLSLGMVWGQGQVQHVRRAVDPSNLYERIVAIVPMVGAGTAANPKRPLLVDMPGVRSFGSDISADGKWALVEIVARDRARLLPAFTNPELTAARMQVGAALQLKIAHKTDEAAAEQVFAEWKRFKPAFDRRRFVVRAQ